METLFEESYFYSVERDEKTDEYFLEVLCGTIAVYNFRVKLMKKEVEGFLQNSAALQPLANRILEAPDKFTHRKV